MIDKASQNTRCAQARFIGKSDPRFLFVHHRAALAEKQGLPHPVACRLIIIEKTGILRTKRLNFLRRFDKSRPSFKTLRSIDACFFKQRFVEVDNRRRDSKRHRVLLAVEIAEFHHRGIVAAAVLPARIVFDELRKIVGRTHFNILANLIDALEGEHRGIALSDAGQSALRELFIIRERRLKPHFDVGMNLIEFLNDLLVNRAEDLAVRMGDSDFDDILRGKNIRSGTGGRNGGDG